MAGASRKGLVNSASFIDSHPARQGSRSLHCLWALGCSPVEYRRTCGGHIEFYLREIGTHINKKLREIDRYVSYMLCGSVPGAQARQDCQPQEELGWVLRWRQLPCHLELYLLFLLAPCLWSLPEGKCHMAKVYSLALCPPTGIQKVCARQVIEPPGSPDNFLAAVTKETASSLSSSHSQVKACMPAVS